jgi:hypothetical protein
MNPKGHYYAASQNVLKFSEKSQHKRSSMHNCDVKSQNQKSLTSCVRLTIATLHHCFRISYAPLFFLKKKFCQLKLKSVGSYDRIYNGKRELRGEGEQMPEETLG